METKVKKTKIVRYKKGDKFGRWFKEKNQLKGWRVVEEVEKRQVNPGKAVVLGAIFLPLALLGSSEYIFVTYEKIDS